MKHGWMCGLVMACALAEASTGSVPAKMTVSRTPELLFTGDYSKDEVSPRKAGEWWALCPGQARWSRAKVRIVPIQDVMFDNGEERTGRRVETPVCPSPVLLARGLQPGSAPVLTTPWTPSPKNEGLEQELSGTLGARPFVIRSEPLSQGGLRVTLRSEEREQVLFSSDFGDDPHWELLWAGDLDGDGRLDLLLEASRKYSIYIRRLFLSSQAGSGELVREVASFEDVSC